MSRGLVHGLRAESLRRFGLGVGVGLLVIHGCGPGPGQRFDPLPPAHLQEGMASWYGRQFAGRRTASGEIFDPGQLTAASPTLPFGALVRVTNVKNGRHVLLRINDRGPYARGRILDCSESAARRLGFRQHGTALVKVEWPPRETDPQTIERQALWLEAGVFESHVRARDLRTRLLRHVEAVDLQREASWVRVAAGPYARRRDAEEALARIREAGFHASLVVGEIPPTAQRSP